MQYLDVVIRLRASVDVGDLGITDIMDLTDDQILGLFDAYEDAEYHVEDQEKESDQLDYRVRSKYEDKYYELCEARKGRKKKETDR